MARLYGRSLRNDVEISKKSRKCVTASLKCLNVWFLLKIKEKDLLHQVVGDFRIPAPRVVDRESKPFHALDIKSN